MPTPTLPTLTPSQIDDLITFARYGETPDLHDLLTSLSQTLHIPPLALLEQARDPVSGNGVVHMAAGNGHDELIQSLPPHAPLYTTPNISGSTPLHYAATNGHLSTVKLLVKSYGADIRVENKAGLTAEEEAGRAGKGEVEGWLEGVRVGGEEGEGEGEEEGVVDVLGTRGREGVEVEVEENEEEGDMGSDRKGLEGRKEYLEDRVGELRVGE